MRLGIDVIAVSALVAIAAISSGCAAAPSSGPMNLGGPDQWTTCMSSDGDKVTFGDLFSISGTQAARLTALRLVNAQGLELEASYVLPVDGGYIGAAAYPPTIDAWKERADVSGALIDPGSEHSFALVVAPIGGGTHTADGFIATYEIGGTKYENQNFVAFEVQERCSE